LKKRDNAILLLDGLDEDPYIIPREQETNALDKFIDRVDEIIEATQEFFVVSYMSHSGISSK